MTKFNSILRSERRRLKRLCAVGSHRMTFWNRCTMEPGKGSVVVSGGREGGMNGRCTGPSWGSEAAAYGAVTVDARWIFIDQNPQSVPHQEGPPVSCGLRVIMMWPWRVITVANALLGIQGVDNGGGRACTGGVCMQTPSSAQCCCEPNTALKKESIKQNKNG